MSYITSNKYTRAGYGKKLREYILKYYIELYIDYTKNPIFALIFGSTNSKEEVVQILSLKTKDYIL